MKKIKRKLNNKNRSKLFDIKNIAFVIAINMIISMIITSIIIKWMVSNGIPNVFC